MNNLVTAFAIALAALPATALPSAAAKIGQGSKPAMLESAPTAKGEKSFTRSVDLECGTQNCTGVVKGKAGRLTRITEIQCVAGSNGQAQGGQAVLDKTLLELLPVASRATEGAAEVAIWKTQTDFSLEGDQSVFVGLFFFGTANYGSCVIKGTTPPL